ncbi:MAG: hypothetical protein FJ272_03135 [Planctomycetes bacterium]|nr:hypothetical protein [Planctomycetota bacterium]
MMARIRRLALRVLFPVLAASLAFAQAGSPSDAQAPVRIAKRYPSGGYITLTIAPSGLTPAKGLSEEQRQANFETLATAIDETYAHFGLKPINWSQVTAQYRERLRQARTDEDFYGLLLLFVNELRDTHSWLQNWRKAVPSYGPGFRVDLFEGKPYVVSVDTGAEAAGAGVTIGSEIIEVDGMTVPQRREQLRSSLRATSSERAFLREACRNLLAGEKDTTVKVTLVPPGGPARAVSLRRASGRYPSTTTMYPFSVTNQEFVHYGLHPSGLGYVHIESFKGREEIADEFDRALEALRAAPGLILDIRDNAGGFGNAHRRIVGRFIASQTLVGMSYVKSGPGHGDLTRIDHTCSPAGPWQYAGPVALLVNDVTGSAADLFACYMRSAGRVTTVGSTTHGNLPGTAAYAVLPCHLIVRISNAYVCDAKGKPIECHGNEPDVAVAPTISDFLNGRDPVLDKAVAVLHAARAAR